MCERLGVCESELLKTLPKFKHGHYDASFVELVAKIMDEAQIKAPHAARVAHAMVDGRL